LKKLLKSFLAALAAAAVLASVCPVFAATYGNWIEVEARGETQTGATIAYRPLYGGDYYATQFKYVSVADSREQTVNVTAYNSGGWQCFDVTNLTPGTTYYGQIILSGASSSVPVTFTTAAGSSSAGAYGYVQSFNMTESAPGAAYASASYSFGAPNASGYIKELGFVYSQTSSYPNVNASGTAKATYPINSYTPSSGSFYATITGLSGAYYARAYMIYNVSGKDATVYSDGNFTYNTNAGSSSSAGIPSVTTTQAYTSGGRVYAAGQITSIGGGAVSAFGFVYSSSNTLPTTENSPSARGTYTNSAAGVFGADFSPAGAGAVTYVRAYADNSYGRAYGNVVSANLSGAGDSRVTLQSVDFVGADSAQFTIYVSSQNSSYLLESGVVVSKTQNPSIDGANVLVCKSPDLTKAGESSITVSGLSNSTTYYARAYVKTDLGTFYNSDSSKSFTTLKEDDISTSPVTDVENTTATAGGKISQNAVSDYTIRQCGVVYSKANTSPEITNSQYVTSDNKAPGEFTVKLTGLTAYTTYYVRAYYQNVQGYVYGGVRTFKTSETSHVDLTSLQSASAGTVSAKGSIRSDIAYNVTDRGFVYSDTNKTPEVTSSGAKSTSAGSGVGDFSADIKSLTPLSVYYVRAYAKTAQGYSYSPVKTVTVSDKRASADIKISYVTANGASVGGQTLSRNIGDVLTASDLTVPEGYLLETSRFEYTVTGSDSLPVTVKPAGKVEAAFAQGSGKRFYPDQPMTRVDVVKMLYALNGSGKTYQGRSFSDVPAYSDGAEAVAYASALGIVNGYEDGTFRPQNSITRGEMAVIIAKAFSLTPKNSVAVNLTDIANHWSRQYVTLGVQNGAMAGYPDGTFKPDNQVTRAEAVTLMSNSSQRSLQPLGSVNFDDVPANHWAYKYIMNAAMPE
jgi:hypothetical protein